VDERARPDRDQSRCCSGPDRRR